MNKKILTVLVALVLAISAPSISANAASKEADTEEKILEIIEEGKEKLGIELSKEDARKLVDVMEQLEDVGFSAEYVIEKAEELYREYGE